MFFTYIECILNWVTAVVFYIFSGDLCPLAVNRVRTTCGRMQWCSRSSACAPCCCSATRTPARGSSTSDDTRSHAHITIMCSNQHVKIKKNAINRLCVSTGPRWCRSRSVAACWSGVQARCLLGSFWWSPIEELTNASDPETGPAWPAARRWWYCSGNDVGWKNIERSPSQSCVFKSH